MRLTILYTFFLFVSVSSSFAQSMKREMRGAWIATVANIDWPLSAGTDAAAQKRQLGAILDNVVACNMNCVVFQIRPTSDALYLSSHEPWSHWLTGTQGAAPSYDPLQYLIDECNRRGLAVHVWINPLRVWLDKANISEATHPSHSYNKHRDMLVTYGKSVYLHPALSEVRDYVSSVVGDIVRRYDIDAVHMDDYFYPYREPGQEFPDEKEYRADPRGFTDKEDWRRDNVDLIVRSISDTIKSVKPWVEFGISPFGIWRNASRDPRGSQTRGQANYDDLYADVLKWMREGWIDYIAPQLYWQIGYQIADYAVLAQWWSDNAYDTPMYIGHSSYRIDPRSSTEAWRTPMEIVRQVRLNRSKPEISGSLMYSAKSLANDEFRKTVTENIYTHKSLVPENRRISPIISYAPRNPEVRIEGGNLVFSWQPSENNRRFVVYRMGINAAGDPLDAANIIAVTGERSLSLPVSVTGSPDSHVFGITSLSPTHKESEMVYFVIEK